MGFTFAGIGSGNPLPEVLLCNLKANIFVLNKFIFVNSSIFLGINIFRIRSRPSCRMTPKMKNVKSWKKNIFWSQIAIYLLLPSFRRRFQPSGENIQLFNRINLFFCSTFFVGHWVWIRRNLNYINIWIYLKKIDTDITRCRNRWIKLPVKPRW